MTEDKQKRPKFDRANLPEEFTEEVVNRMTAADVQWIRTAELTEKQRVSYEAIRDQRVVRVRDYFQSPGGADAFAKLRSLTEQFRTPQSLQKPIGPNMDFAKADENREALNNLFAREARERAQAAEQARNIASMAEMTAAITDAIGVLAQRTEQQHLESKAEKKRRAAEAERQEVFNYFLAFIAVMAAIAAIAVIPDPWKIWLVLIISIAVIVGVYLFRHRKTSAVDPDGEVVE